MTEETGIPKDKKGIKFVHLEPAVILQINATIIAGALILLTLGSAMINVQGKATIQYTLTLLTVAVIVPFSFSSMLALKEGEKNQADAKKFLIAGFMVLMIALLALAIIVFPWSGQTK